MAGGSRSGTLDALALRVDPRRWSNLYVPWRVLLTAIMVGLVAALYYPASILTEGRSVDLTTTFDAIIPFVPWTWWVYFPHYVFALTVTTVVLPDLRVVLRSFLAILLSQTISSLCYLILPSTYPRPSEVGEADAITTAAVSWFWTTDPPNNTFPSTHVANACLAAFGAWHSRHPVRWYAALAAAGVFVTVHTAKQHYWVDAVGGVLLATLAFRLAFRIWPMPKEDDR